MGEGAIVVDGMSAFRYEFPSPRGGAARPLWTGDAFRIGEERRRVIAYDVGQSGWSDELTRWHDAAGGGSHFIDVASRRSAVASIRRLNTLREPIILEVGCASGYLLRDLVAAFPAAHVMGADFTLATLETLAGRIAGVPLLCFDLVRCPLPSTSVDIVVTLNVLEHIERDDLALAQVWRILKPGGLMIAEVPAGPALYGAYDKLLMHFRRYELSSLERLTRAVGFETLERSHLGFFLYPGFWLAKKLALGGEPRNAGEERDQLLRPIAATGRWNRPLQGVMNVEERLRRLVPLPFGIRCLINCRKPRQAPDATGAARRTAKDVT